MAVIDPERVAALIAEIAETEIMPRYGRLDPEEISTKSSATDLVTVVDEATERALEKALKEVYPGAEVIGEERAAREPESVAALDGPGAFWVVDPLDGTRNFVRGVDEFGVIVAFVVDGQALLGWIYAAPDQACAIASLNDGASWRGEMVEPRPPAADGALHGLRSVGWLVEPWRDRLIGNLREHFTSTSLHCSAYAYIKVLRGEADFKLASRIHPWDHAAGVLMLNEVGGRTAFLDDDDPYSPRSSADRPLLSVAGERDWEAIAAKLRG